MILVDTSIILHNDADYINIAKVIKELKLI